MKTENLLNFAIQASVEAGFEIMKVFKSNDFQIEHKLDSSPVTIADKNAHQIIVDILENTKLPVLSEEGRNIHHEERINWERYWLVDPLDGTKEFVKRNTDFTVNIALIEKNKPILGVIYIPVTKELFYGEKEMGSFKYQVENENSDFQFENIFHKLQKLDATCRNENLTIVGSRSHVNAETVAYFETLKTKYPNTEISSRGSSLKFCILAEGKAHLAPRIGPTYEWDTAAGHAILNAAGGYVYQWGSDTELIYNKENLLNPNFLAKTANSIS